MGWRGHWPRGERAQRERWVRRNERGHASAGGAALRAVRAELAPQERPAPVSMAAASRLVLRAAAWPTHEAPVPDTAAPVVLGGPDPRGEGHAAHDRDVDHGDTDDAPHAAAPVDEAS